MTQLIPISKLFEKEKKKMRKQDKVEKGGAGTEAKSGTFVHHTYPGTERSCSSVRCL